MNKAVLIRTALFAAIMLGWLHSLRAQTEAIVPGGTARLTFFDDFNGPSLDRSKWSSNYTNAMRNLPEEEQIYTPDSFEIRDGQLNIIAERRDISGYKFTSGALTSFGSFEQTYGYFEIRARLPKGRGLWPALWMLPADRSWPPEIDIMEFLGREPQHIWTTFNWLSASAGHSKDGSRSVAKDWTKEFHRFAVQWKPGLLAWYIDGKQVKLITGKHVPSTKMFLLMNLAIGGHWSGPVSSETQFPATFQIDYVKAYQYNDLIEFDERPFRYLITNSTDQIVSRADEVRIDFGIENRSLIGAHRFQLVLKDAVSERQVSQHDTQVILDRKGEFRRSWNLRIPDHIKPGLYVVSFGLFSRDWTKLDWLNNAKTILVRG